MISRKATWPSVHDSGNNTQVLSLMFLAGHLTSTVGSNEAVWTQIFWRPRGALGNIESNTILYLLPI